MNGGEELTIPLLQSFKVSKLHKDNTFPIQSLAYDDAGQYLVTTSNDESIRLYSCQSGNLKDTIYSKKYGCALATFTHRSNNILYASVKQDDAIRYMSLHDNKYLRYFKGHTSRVSGLDMSPKDDYFVSTSAESTRIWDLKSPTAVSMIENGQIRAGAGSSCVAIDPSGKVFALGLNNNSIRMYSMVNTSGPFLSVPVNSNGQDWTKLEFSNCGKYLLVSTKSNELYLLDAMKGNALHTLRGHLNTFQVELNASFTPDGKYVLCGSSDGKIHMWESATGNRINELLFHSDAVRNVKFNPTSLLFASSDTNLAMWTPPFL